MEGIEQLANIPGAVATLRKLVELGYSEIVDYGDVIVKDDLEQLADDVQRQVASNEAYRRVLSRDDKQAQRESTEGD